MDKPDKIHFNCPQCQKAVKAPLESAGKRAKCKGCGTVVLVPRPVGDFAPEPLSLDNIGDEPGSVPPRDVITSNEAPSKPLVGRKVVSPSTRPAKWTGGRRWALVGFVLMLLLGLGVYFALPKETGTTAKSEGGNEKMGPGKDGTQTIPKGTIVGTYGEWEVQLIRIEFVGFLRERERSRMGDRVFYDDVYGTKGKTPTETLLVSLQRVCLRDTKVTPKDGFVARIPSFSVVGKAEPLPLRSMATGIVQGSQKEIELAPAHGLLGFGGKGEYTKGHAEGITVVVGISKGDADAAARDGIRIRVSEFVSGHQVDLPLTIPGDKN